MKDRSLSWPSLKAAGVRTKNKAQEISGLAKPSAFLLSWAAGRYFQVRTYGCQANVRDSEVITAYLQNLGMKPTTDPVQADIIIFNTCAIREHAETRIFGELGHLAPLAKQNHDLIIGLCGCMAHEEVTLEKLRKNVKHLNLVFGTGNIHQLYSLIEEQVKSKDRIFCVSSDNLPVVEEYPEARFERYKAFVNIMYGCDKFCTYCIVPYTRGQQRSRNVEDIVLEVKHLVEKGYKEVTLLGQNVNAFGLDFEDKTKDFAYLLEQIAKTGIARIRFTSPHPADFKEKVFKVMSEYKNIMPALHLPMQSGSSRVLKKMNRSYDRQRYLDLVKMLRSYIPDVRLTTDIICCFPGETEEDFEDTLSIIKEANFAGAYTFIYSPRNGTPAARWDNPLTPEEKQARFNRLASAIDEQATIAGNEAVGQEVEVLFDSLDDKIGLIKGYDQYNRLVHVEAPSTLIGQIKKVKILESHTYSFIGELLD